MGNIIKLQNVFIFLFFVVLVFGLLVASENHTAGPRIVDDNQIYRLNIDLSENSFFDVAKDEVLVRFFSYKRLIPVFSFHKVLEAKLFGTNLFYWSMYTGAIAVLTAYFLYLFFINIKYSVIESLLFSTISVVGLQSVLWWKLIHGEGLAMMFLSLSLLAMSRSVNKDKNVIWSLIAFILFAFLAALSKESFILLLPALIFWRVWLLYERNGGDILVAIKSNAVVAAYLGSFFLYVLLLIKIVNSETIFSGYAGWDGFDRSIFYEKFLEFLVLSDLYILLVPMVACIALIVYVRITKVVVLVKHHFFKYIFFPFGLFVLIVIPQILLYMKSGFYIEDDYSFYFQRYLLPGMIGYAFLSVFLLRELRVSQSSGAFDSAKYVWLASVLIMSSLIIFKFGDAYESAERDGEMSNAFKVFYQNIDKHTNENDVILLVFNSAVGLREPVRIKYILNSMLHRKNIYYLGLPERLETEWSDSSVEINKYKPEITYDRHVNKLSNVKEIDAVISVLPKELESSFFRAESAWLNKTEFILVPSNIAGYKLFSRKIR